MSVDDLPARIIEQHRPDGDDSEAQCVWCGGGTEWPCEPYRLASGWQRDRAVRWDLAERSCRAAEEDRADARRLMRHFPTSAWDGTLHHAVLIADTALTPDCPSCGDLISDRYLKHGVCGNCAGTTDDPRARFDVQSVIRSVAEATANADRQCPGCGSIHGTVQ